MSDYDADILVWSEHQAGLPDTIDGQPSLPAPEVCPVTLDGLLGDGP